MGQGFEDFEPIFGKPNAEWESSSLNSSSPPFLPLLSHVHALDTYSLRIHVTDFHSFTWEATRSIQQLQDMRDNIGVGGSWAEFVAYFVDSFKSDNVRLLVGPAKPNNSPAGALSAKLVAHKAKGMPRISISLGRLTESSASDAMANLSLGLFKAFQGKHGLAIKEEHGQSHQLTKDSPTKQVKDESTRNQLDAALNLKRQKLHKLSTSEETRPVTDISVSNASSVPDKHESPKKPLTQDPRPTKVSNRVVPAYRRAKVRGAVLEDTEDGDE